jgi:hypothetical protein
VKVLASVQVMKKLKALAFNKYSVAGAALLGVAVSSQAQTDATTIITSATSAFALVAGLCVSIGTFFVVYRLVKKVG